MNTFSYETQSLQTYFLRSFMERGKCSNEMRKYILYFIIDIIIPSIPSESGHRTKQLFWQIYRSLKCWSWIDLRKLIWKKLHYSEVETLIYILIVIVIPRLKLLNIINTVIDYKNYPGIKLTKCYIIDPVSTNRAIDFKLNLQTTCDLYHSIRGLETSILHLNSMHRHAL